MGFDDPRFSESVDQMIDTALDAPNPWLRGITRTRLEQESQVRLNFEAQTADRSPEPPVPFLPFARGGFHTFSSKAELYSEALVAQGLDPVVEFVPPVESRHGNGANTFPLELLARKADNFLNSTFSNLPAIQAMEENGLLNLHSVDADARGIRQATRCESLTAEESCSSGQKSMARFSLVSSPRPSIERDSVPVNATSTS